MRWFWIGLGIIVLVFLSIYNRIKRSRVGVEEALAGIDVALAKRFAAITGLVEVVKGYAKHERELLTLVTEKRQIGRIDYENDLDSMASRLIALSEAYPDLKADEHFLHLQRALFDTEEHIQAARRLYNARVATLNKAITMFPGSFVNIVAGEKRADFYEAKGTERVIPEVHFEGASYE